jgi:hypothetical protein
LKFLALADEATQRAKRWVKRQGRRSGWCWQKNSINFTEKNHQTSLFWFFFWQWKKEQNKIDGVPNMLLSILKHKTQTTRITTSSQTSLHTIFIFLDFVNLRFQDLKKWTQKQTTQITIITASSWTRLLTIFIFLEFVNLRFQDLTKLTSNHEKKFKSQN